MDSLLCFVIVVSVCKKLYRKIRKRMCNPYASKKKNKNYKVEGQAQPNYTTTKSSSENCRIVLYFLYARLYSFSIYYFSDIHTVLTSKVTVVNL